MKSAGSLRQAWLLLGLWWRHMRRRAARLGDAPKQSGAPTFLLLNLLVSSYMAALVWGSVARSAKKDPALFAWHMAGILLVALGTGLSKGAQSLQLRGTRNDAFLQPLPLHLLARLGLQIADSVFVVPLAIVVPLAAQHALGRPLLVPALLGPLAYVALFVVGQAMVAWARALGPPSTARSVGFVGVGLYVAGMAAAFTPIGQVLGSVGGRSAQVAELWLGEGMGRAVIAIGLASAMGIAFFVLAAAERWGFDRLDATSATPKAQRGVRDRVALEWQMMLRQGGRPLLVIFSGLLVGAVYLVFFAHAIAKLTKERLLFVAGFAIYLGAIQTIAQAGRAARSDLLARPFLAALPLSPHQVLDGKAQALRKLLLPVLAILALLGGIAAWDGDLAMTYRLGLAIVSLYVVVDGAVSVAFLSNGIGVVGVGGGAASSGFSTQLLMMPLLATVMAPGSWAATTSFVAVVAVTWEARRAAQRSVRWIDDPADDVVRETTVWRALLAATAFFALQALSYQLLSFLEVPPGYMLASAFAASAIVLGLLTWRNGGRFVRPAFFPTRWWAWPAGLLAGAGSGLLALQMAKLLPAPAEAAAGGTPRFDTGELTALAVTMTIVAPLVEEYFFRGWLQKAIEADLPDGKKRWAFVLGACAFALAHLGSYGVPQLVLGLFAGALYAWGGGLWPAILAHAIHNGVVLLLAGNGS